MTIEQAEAELIRVLDAKVAAGAKLRPFKYQAPNGCGCALEVYADDRGNWYETTRAVFGWSPGELIMFAQAFDGVHSKAPFDNEHAALGDRIARRYGVR